MLHTSLTLALSASLWSILASVAAPSQDEAPPDPQPPRLAPSDYEQWESFGWERHAVSPDGRWLAFPVERVDGEEELRVRSLSGEPRHVFPWGADPRFSSDSNWLVRTARASDDERERGKAAGEPVRDGVGLLSLADGTVREFDDVREASFDETGRHLPCT